MNEIFKVMPTNEREDDWVVVVGKHLATTRHFQTKSEAMMYMDTPKWDTILALVSEMIEINEEEKLKTEENE